MGVLSNRVDRDSLKPGDHIYSWRTGYIYAHHGIYVRDNKVIHFTRHGEEVGTGTVLDLLLVSSVPAGSLVPCPTCILPEEGHGVFSSCLDCFLAGGILYRFEYSVSHALFLVKARGGTCTLAVSDPEDIVVHRANYLLENGFGCYNVFKNNCEDFAIYCKTGLLVMDQKTVGMSGQAASIIGGPLAAVLTSPLRLVTNNVFGMVATAVGVYCATRYAADIGMRKDVVKVPVEEMTERLANGTLQVAMQEVSPASALPNAQEVANAFVDQYYPVLHHSPDMLHKFYLDSSVLNWPNTNGVMTSVTTMQAINEKILSSDYKNYKVEIKTTDAQDSYMDGVIVVITGCLTGKDNAKRNFTQTFFLAPQETGYVVLNDLFRYIDESESLDFGSVSVNGVTENAPTANMPSDPEPTTPTHFPDCPSSDPVATADLAATSDPAATFEAEDLNNGTKVSDPSDNIDGTVLVEEVVDELPIHSSQKEIISSVSSDIAPAQEEKKSYASIVKIAWVAKASTPVYVPTSRAKVVPANADQRSLGSPKSSSKPEALGSNSAPESKHAHEEVKGHSVYVRNLPFNATDTQLEEVLKKFGPIKRDGIQVRSNQRGFCFGFVEFESLGSMTDAIKASPLMIGGRSAVVEEKRTTTQVGSGGRGRYPSGSGRGWSRNDNFRGRGNYGGGRGGYYGRSEYRNRSESSGRSKGPSGIGIDSYQRVDHNGSGTHKSDLST